MNTNYTFATNASMSLKTAQMVTKDTKSAISCHMYTDVMDAGFYVKPSGESDIILLGLSYVLYWMPLKSKELCQHPSLCRQVG